MTESAEPKMPHNQSVQIFFLTMRKILLKMREKVRQPKMSKFLSIFWTLRVWFTFVGFKNILWNFNNIKFYYIKCATFCVSCPLREIQKTMRGRGSKCATFAQNHIWTHYSHNTSAAENVLGRQESFERSYYYIENREYDTRHGEIIPKMVRKPSLILARAMPREAGSKVPNYISLDSREGGKLILKSEALHIQCTTRRVTYFI